MRWNETWHRLKDWSDGQPKSEAIAAHILLAEGFTDIDPSHPRGGKDGGKDAIAVLDGQRWVMAAYFPAGDNAFKDIKDKFVDDHSGASTHDVAGMAFVTNQVLTLGQRESLKEAATLPVKIYHRESIALILDSPPMHPVREQFLLISAASNAASADREWDEPMRRRLAAGLHTGQAPSAYLCGRLVRRAAEPMLADFRVAPVHLRVAEIDGLDVLTLQAKTSPRPVYLWIGVVAPHEGVVTVAANSLGTVFGTELAAVQASYDFSTVDDAREAVENAVNWGLRLLAGELRAPQ